MKVPIPKLDCQGIPFFFFLFFFSFLFFGHPNLLLRGDSWGRPLTAPDHWRCFLTPAASSRPAAQAGWRRARCAGPRVPHLPWRLAPQWLGWGRAVWRLKPHSPNVLPSSRSRSSFYSRCSSGDRLRIPSTLRFSSNMPDSLATVKTAVFWRRIMGNTSWGRRGGVTAAPAPPPAPAWVWLPCPRAPFLFF